MQKLRYSQKININSSCDVKGGEMEDDQNPEIDEQEDTIDPENDEQEDTIDPESNYYDSELGQMGETDDEKTMSVIERKIFERREQRLHKKIDNIIRKAPNRFFPFFTPWEKKTIEEAKRHKNLRKKLNTLSWMMNAARMRKHMQGMSLVPLIVQAGFWALIIILAISVAVSIAYVLGLIDSNGNENSGESGAAPMGPKGKDFYAVRAVYTDEEQAEIDQIEDYIDILRGVKEQIDTDISGLEITFNLDLPEDEEMSTFIESKNTGDFIIAYETMSEMAGVVYKYDNVDGAETDLSVQLGLIKYFGYNAEILSLAGENNDLTDIIKANLLQYQSSLFVPVEDDGELPADLTDTINASVDTYMATVSNLRAEKYYIKDFVLDGDDATMEGIETKNYKAIMMYAKTDFDAQLMQFYAKNVDVEKFVTYIDDFGSKTEFDIVPSGNDDYYNKNSTGGQSSQQEPENKLYNYEIDHAFSIIAGEEPTYLNTIVEGKNVLNLYDILVAGNVENSTILTGAIDDADQVIEDVYSYKITGYAIVTEYDSAFGFTIMLEPKSDFIG